MNDNANKTEEEWSEDSIWEPISNYSDETLSAPSSAVEENEIDDDSEENTTSRRNVLIIGGIALFSTIPLGLGSGYLYKKNETKKNATAQLSNLKKSYGSITPVNTTINTFSGQKLKDVNVEQKSLVGGTDNTSAEAAVFIFSNGKNNPKRIVDVYIDFDSQVSRDFVLINQSSLKNMVENGLIELRIHPVSSGSALSIYSPEALAESFVTSPELSWEFMLSLLKLSAEVQANGDIEILPAIEEKIAENGIKNISAESIQNGTFSSWIIEVGNDERLKTGYYPPIIYVNDIIIDPNIIEFNNVDAIRRHILSFDVKE